jgi:hypothetical protein
MRKSLKKNGSVPATESLQIRRLEVNFRIRILLQSTRIIQCVFVIDVCPKWISFSFTFISHGIKLTGGYDVIVQYLLTS